jgi:Ser/Thr protein kinase RdoA (MazF antagonist)
MLLRRLLERRDWLRSSSAPRLPDLSHLGCQVLHGDYQDANLFFRGHEVSAIIDWDQSYATPRA